MNIAPASVDLSPGRHPITFQSLVGQAADTIAAARHELGPTWGPVRDIPKAHDFASNAVGLLDIAGDYAASSTAHDQARSAIDLLTRGRDHLRGADPAASTNPVPEHVRAARDLFSEAHQTLQGALTH